MEESIKSLEPSLKHHTQNAAVMEETYQPRKCPECGRKSLVEDGETVCTSCGLVLERSVNRTMDFRIYTPDEWRVRSHHGPAVDVHSANRKLTTEITCGPFSSFEERKQAHHLQQVNILARGAVEKRFNATMFRLHSITSRMNLPSHVKMEASSIFKKVMDKKLTQGRTVESLLVASVAIACRLSGVPRQLREIAKLEGVKYKLLTKDYRTILEELKIKLPLEDPSKYVGKIASPLNIPAPVQVKAAELLKGAEGDRHLLGKNPMGLAAASLYMAGRTVNPSMHLSYSELSKVVGMSEATLRKDVSWLVNAKPKPPQTVRRRRRKKKSGWANLKRRLPNVEAVEKRIREVEVRSCSRSYLKILEELRHYYSNRRARCRSKRKKPTVGS